MDYIKKLDQILLSKITALVSVSSFTDCENTRYIFGVKLEIMLLGIWKFLTSC